MSEESFSWSESDLAGAGKRYQGQFLDGLITLLIFLLLVYLVKLSGIDHAVLEVIVFAVPASYFLFSDGFSNGQSWGKKLLNIAVVNKETGKSCSIIQSFFRNSLTPLIGVIDAIFILTKTRQRLGDKLANTIVIRVRKRS